MALALLVLLGLGRLATAALLGEKDSVDVGEDPTLGNGHAGQQLVELLVITNSELNITIKVVNMVNRSIFPT